ncbi:sensor histidine kinase [Massilia sp. SR12]
MKHPRTRKLGRRSSDSALAEIREDERVHISRELHDDLGQLLATLRVELALFQQLPHDAPETQERLAGMDALLLQAIGSLRRITGNLRPRELDEGGLYFALDALRCEFETRHKIGCRLDALPDTLVLDERYSTAIYRLVQESLTNIARHASASSAHIQLQRNGAELHLDISDDGRGIAAGAVARADALGLLGMRERVAALCGSMSVDGANGAGGTRIAIRIPLPANSTAAAAKGVG